MNGLYGLINGVQMGHSGRSRGQEDFENPAIDPR
jgi:hypothetical protein